MLTYDKFLNHNEESNIKFNVYSDRIDIDKPKDSVVKEFEHNFEICLNMDIVQNLVLNISLPQRIPYIVNISYREKRVQDVFSNPQEKKWQYIIKARNGEIITEGVLEGIEKISKNIEKNTKDKIIEILKYINYKNISIVPDSLNEGSEK